jgi:hypothetical protein
MLSQRESLSSALPPLIILNHELTEQVCCEFSRGRFLFLSLKPHVSPASRTPARVTTPRVRDYEPNHSVASICWWETWVACSCSCCLCFCYGNQEMESGNSALGIPYSRSRPDVEAMEQVVEQEYSPKLSDRGPKTFYRRDGLVGL